MSPKKPPALTGKLYWLAVLAALEGLTVLRMDDASPRELAVLWGGTVLGVALGQLLAWTRIRGWVLAALALTGFWLVPFAYIVLWHFGDEPSAKTFALTIVPAAAGGYLSLSERGALFAFWYPTVLWMLVILDGGTDLSFDGLTALPYLAALGVLFVAFLRARQSRRAALWESATNERLAAPRERKVLRASPLRATSTFGWTGLTVAVALVLVAWIAPHLWQRRHDPLASAARDPAAARHAYGIYPCCPDAEDQTTVSEYLPLLHGQPEPSPRAGPCTYCRYGQPVTQYTYLGTSHVAYETGGPIVATPEPTPAAPPARPSAATDHAYAQAPPPPRFDPPPAYDAPPPPAVRDEPRPLGRPPAPAPALPDPSPLWRWALAACAAALVLRLLGRALRRALTLRHLERPFWPETLDQRISNHWQRVLIGLRDAGVRPTKDEPPQTFARRVGVDGVDACATILERVRHGVRVDAGDLDAMGEGATVAYRTARRSAGVLGRAVAWLRWPLA
jgi:hypothetical protein